MKHVSILSRIFFAAVCLTPVAACSHKPGANPEPPHADVNAIYWWKTVWNPDSAELAFLEEHEIERLYIRFFDVVPDESEFSTEALIPNATLIVDAPVEVEEIVPVVYITPEALARMRGSTKGWAAMIVKRIYAMCSYNDMGMPAEIQLDCDWTNATADIFFDLCTDVRNEINAHNMHDYYNEAGEYCSGQGEYVPLSATVRLHQLSRQAPPVDYGVLMLYNTGSFASAAENNSILSADNVRPYVDGIQDYPLHLDFAWPAYGWQLLFKDGKFAGILRGEHELQPGEYVRTEASDFKTLMSVKQMVDKAAGNRERSNVIYHLDSENLSKYRSDEIEALYK